jgi:cytidylate kinase
MKIVVIGAEGSGKSYIAGHMARTLKISLIEATPLTDFESMNLQGDWILEGEIDDIPSMIYSEADKVLVIEGSNLISLYRALKRDWKNFAKTWYQLQHYEKMNSHRQKLIHDLKALRPHDVEILDNFPHITDSALAAFTEHFKMLPKSRKGASV